MLFQQFGGGGGSGQQAGAPIAEGRQIVSGAAGTDALGSL